jgi:excisionase family DNA binding protein
MEHLEETKPEPLLLTISQVAQRLGLSRTYVYKLIATDGLPTVHFGRAVRISLASLQKWLEEREQRDHLS